MSGKIVSFIFTFFAAYAAIGVLSMYFNFVNGMRAGMSIPL